MNLKQLRRIVDEAETKLNNGSRKTSRRTCKRNFSQDHTSAVTEQTEDLVFIHIHLIGPARGTSNRQIIPAQLLNRWRISSSSTYISSDLQEELHRIMPAQLLNRLSISSSSISKEWTLRQLSKFYESWLWIMFMDLVFIHIYLVGPTRGTFSQDYASAVTEQTEDLIFIHIPGMDSFLY